MIGKLFLIQWTLLPADGHPENLPHRPSTVTRPTLFFLKTKRRMDSWKKTSGWPGYDGMAKV